MPRLPFFFVVLAGACAGSSNQIVVDQQPTQVTVDAHQEVHQDVRVDQQVMVDGHGDQGGGLIATGGHAACPGLSVQDVGQTRPGRALAMALLQVSARPWVDLSVDGMPQGRTPLVAVGVEAGPREVRLTHPGYACTFRLHAHAGRRYSISADVEMAPAAR